MSRPKPAQFARLAPNFSASRGTKPARHFLEPSRLAHNGVNCSPECLMPIWARARLVSQDSTCQGCQERRKLVVSGTNVVAMARHGPILKDNEATGSGKVFKYLPGLRDTIKKSKIAAKVQKSKNTAFYRIFNIWGRRHGRSPYYKVDSGKVDLG